MRATSIGHAGILVDTLDGSIVCDPWFMPQFHGSWFVFPRNDQLSDELMHRICHPTYLYISHIHADHLDEGWLVEHMDKDTTVLIPGYPTRELERILRGLGFHSIVRPVDGEEMRLAFAKMGFDRITGTPEAMSEFMRKERERVAHVVKEAGIKGE